MNIVSLQEASGRLRADHELLLARVAGLAEDQLAASYRVASGPLGDFCDSLHDLLAHVLMWDEINLAVLSEATAGRAHWSLDPRWETPEAGRLLNRGGVAAARQGPGGYPGLATGSVPWPRRCGRCPGSLRSGTPPST